VPNLIHNLTGNTNTAALLSLTLYLSGQSTSRGHNTVANWRSMQLKSIGRTSPATKSMGRTSAQLGSRPIGQVSSLRPYYRPSRQVLCGSVVPSTESIGCIRIGHDVVGPTTVCRVVDMHLRTNIHADYNMWCWTQHDVVLLYMYVHVQTYVVSTTMTQIRPRRWLIQHATLW
jgi:hypothetical protein